jgi:hypothetical protein
MRARPSGSVGMGQTPRRWFAMAAWAFCSLSAAMVAMPGGAAGTTVPAGVPVRVSVAAPAAVLASGSTQSLAVTVESDGRARAPTGRVTLTISAAGVAATEQALALTPTAGSASAATVRIDLPPVAGSVTIDAAYEGDATHQAGSGHHTVVLGYASSVSVAPDCNPCRPGEDAALTVTVTSQDPSSVPSGHVRLRSTLVDRVLPLVDGSAGLTLQDLSAGRHVLDVQYWPDTAHLGSAAALTLAVQEEVPAARPAEESEGRDRTKGGRAPLPGGRLLLADLPGAGWPGHDALPFGARADGFTAVRLLGDASLVGSWSLAATGFAPRLSVSFAPAPPGALLAGAGAATTPLSRPAWRRRTRRGPRYPLGMPFGRIRRFWAAIRKGALGPP